MIAEDNVKAAFAKRLSELRREKGITQLRLADDLNYSDKAVSKWERAESVPDAYTLLKLAEYFGVSLDYLLGGEENTKELVPQTTEKENEVKQGKKKVLHTFIPLLSVVAVFIIASIVFFVLKNLNIWNGSEQLSFVYALAASAVVLVVFSHIWGKIFERAISVSLLIWFLALSAYLSVPLAGFKYIFIPAAVSQIACITAYGFFYKIKK